MRYLPPLTPFVGFRSRTWTVGLFFPDDLLEGDLERVGISADLVLNDGKQPALIVRRQAVRRRPHRAQGRVALRPCQGARGGAVDTDVKGHGALC